MRLNMWRPMVWAILAVGLIIVPASAIGAPPKANSGTASTNTVVTSLHQAKTLLDTAIHDYDGHRGKAVEELHHAIRELSPHTQGHKTTGANKGNAAGANKGNANKGNKETTTPGETQAQSDVQLKQALQLLASLEGQVSNAKAATHIQNAVNELNTALKIK